MTWRAVIGCCRQVQVQPPRCHTGISAIHIVSVFFNLLVPFFSSHGFIRLLYAPLSRILCYTTSARKDKKLRAEKFWREFKRSVKTRVRSRRNLTFFFFFSSCACVRICSGINGRFGLASCYTPSGKIREWVYSMLLSDILVKYTV